MFKVVMLMAFFEGFIGLLFECLSSFWFFFFVFHVGFCGLVPQSHLYFRRRCEGRFRVTVAGRLTVHYLLLPHSLANSEAKKVGRRCRLPLRILRPICCGDRDTGFRAVLPNDLYQGSDLYLKIVFVDKLLRQIPFTSGSTCDNLDHLTWDVTGSDGELHECCGIVNLDAPVVASAGGPNSGFLFRR